MKEQMLNFINGNEARGLVNSHLLTLLPFEEKHQKIKCSPYELLTPARFDLIAKYLYAMHIDKDAALTWAEKVYYEHLLAFGGLVEGDYSGKNSFEDYKRVFNEILLSIKENGFDESNTLIPIDSNDVIIDGAHRLASCLYFNKEAYCLLFNYKANVYDYNYFNKSGLPENVADYMALNFCKINKNIYFAVLFPVAKNKDSEVENYLLKCGDILYKKEVVFSKNGRKNLISQLYKGESWLGENGEITLGLVHHIENRFNGNKPVKFYFFESHNYEKMLEIKSKIRNIFELENDSIHMNDTHEETVRIAEQVLNKNSIHFLNNAEPWKSKKFNSLLKEYKLKVNNLDKETFCIDTGGVLAAFGVRDTDDLDYLHFRDHLVDVDTEIICAHNEELKYHEKNIGELLYNPENYFYYDGLKYLSLKMVRSMKVCRNEAKDVRDVMLIDSISCDKKSVIDSSVKLLKYKMMVLNEQIKGFKMWKIKKIIPKIMQPFARKIFNLPFYVKEQIGPYEKKMSYKGYVLNYSKGTSLIQRIVRGKTYEPGLTIKLTNDLKNKKNPVFLDIGANIGLISLNLLSCIKNLKIYAFEPGPHQYQFLKKTINDNELNNQVEIYQEALSNKQGVAKFSIHNSKHASGDGFLDTGRSGNTNLIEVKCNTLDNWWVELGSNHIDVIKIDSEGAELWILEGARNLICHCKPIIYLEINNENLSPYPYNEKDIFNYFNDVGYILSTIDGIQVTSENIIALVKKTDDFVAITKDRK